MSATSFETKTTLPQEELVGVVGQACRVPGATNTRDLWKLIMSQKDMRRKMPSDRFNVDAYYHPEGKNKGTTNAVYGYFLDQDLSLFDAGFFNISGNEAQAMDPQQRILMEVVYEALEDAGISMESIAGSNTSVYCGSFTADYAKVIGKDMQAYPKYTVTGTGQSILANRISYFFDLHGESMTLDTACSSSLVGFHLGVESLKNKHSDMCIIVGAALHYVPEMFQTMTDFGMLSPNGRSMSYDAMGRGYSRGEGIAAVVLKPVKTAMNDGDSIRAVVRGSGSNHDGIKPGITLPAPEAQEALIRRVYEQANVRYRDTYVFEGHGTGTSAGDPREATAIAAVFNEPGRTEPLRLGSIKSNIGHLEGAAGLAGVIKMTNAIQQKTIAPNMWFKNPNPQIKFADWKLKVPTQAEVWPETDQYQRASINSFGYGGSNAHVIIEAFKPHDSSRRMSLLPHYEQTSAKTGRPYLIALTSHSENAGKKLAGKFAEYVKEHPEVDVQSFAQTLSTRRSMHDHRTFITASSPADLQAALENVQQTSSWVSDRPAQKRVAFSFSGQGAQYPKMGYELLQTCPSFKRSMLRCEKILSQLPDGPDWSLITELSQEKANSKVNQPERSQPLCTSIQLSIIDLLTSWGVKPSACVGHSSGEMAAAYAAGVLTFETALIYSYYRGLYANKNRPEALPIPSSMMAIGMGPLEAEETLQPYNGTLSIAAVNSPTSCTISGDEEAILKLKEDLTAKKVFARQLVVQIGYHSHHMKVFTETYKRSMEECPFVSPPMEAKCRMFSSVTARVARGETMGPQYWVDNMNGTVRFSDALTGVLLDEADEQNVDMLVEIGPHTALKGPTKDIMKSVNTDIPYVATLTRGEHAYHALLKTAGNLFSLGYPVDLTAVNEGMGVERLNDLPTYAWDHVSYWAATRIVREELLRKWRHSVLGFPMPGWTHHSQRWRNYLRASELTWMNDHQIQGRVVFPATGYLSMALDGVLFSTPAGSVIRDVSFGDIAINAALTLPSDDSGREIIVELTARPVPGDELASSYDFHISSFDDSEKCIDNCHGWVQINFIDQQAPDAEQQQLVNLAFPPPPPVNQSIDHGKLYKKLASYGLGYGEQFQLCANEIKIGDNVAVANLISDNQDPSAEFMTINPAILDACLHPVFAAFEGHLERPLTETFVPSTLKSLRIPGKTLATLNRGPDVEPESFDVMAKTTQPGPRRVMADIYVRLSETQEPVAQVLGMEAVSLGDTSTGAKRSVYSRIKWQPSIRFLANGDSIIPKFERLQDILDLYVHERPQTSILYIGSDVATFKDEWQSHVGGRAGERRRYEKLYLATDAEAPVPVTPFDVPDVELGLPEESSCGLAIVDETTSIDVAKYLAADGLVIKQAKTSVQSPTIFNYFESQGLQCWKKTPETKQQNQNRNSTLAVLTSSAPSNRSMDIIASVKSSYAGSVEVHDLDKLNKKKIEALPNEIVVLSSIDDDLFLHEGKEDVQRFEVCRSLLSGSDKRLVWVTEGASYEPVKPHNAMITGLIRTARSENELSMFVTLDVPTTCGARRLARLISQSLNPENDEDELADRNGTICTPRMIMDDSLNSRLEDGFGRVPRPTAFKQDRHLQVKPDTLDHENFVFEDRHVPDIKDDEIEVQVMAASLTLEAAHPSIETHATLAPVDYAGYVTAKGSAVSDFNVGDRVLAWMPVQQTICNIVRAHSSMCLPLGSESFSQAVNWCSDMTKAYHALVNLARLRHGDSVMVLSADSALGQLTVQVAKNLGAEVIAVVDSIPSQEFQDALGLDESQIILSRTLTSHKTGLSSVSAEVIVNTASGCLEEIAWSAFAGNGHIIDLAQSQTDTLASLRERLLRSAIRYSPVNLSTASASSNDSLSNVLAGASETKNTMQMPTKINEYPIDQASRALKSLRGNEKVNKAVLTVSENRQEQILALPHAFAHKPLFNASKTYLLVGGFGGLGTAVAEWMCRKGARNLAFFSRSGAKGEDAKQAVARLEEQGVKVQVFKGDLSNFQSVQSCIESLGSSLAGVFQMAGIFRDALLQKMTYEQWRFALAPKVAGTANLSDATIDSKLDFFVSFASLSGIVGNKGQANYSAANTYIDALMRQRRSQGLPGYTLDIGMVLDAGHVAGDSGLQQVMERNGFDYVAEHELYRQLEISVTESSSRETSNREGIDTYQICSGGRMLPNDNFRGNKPMHRPLWADLAFEEGGSSGGDAKQDLMKLLGAAKDDGEKQRVLLEAFTEKLAMLCGIAVETIDAASSLAKYGLDSLLAVDIRNWFLKQVKVDLPLFVILGAKSIRALIAEAAANLAASSADDSSEQTASKDAKETSTAAGLDTEIQIIPRPKQIPLSTYQDRMWFLHQFLDDKTNLNLRIISWMTGHVEHKALESALRQLKRRNEVFRTAFIQHEDFAEQRILDDDSVDFPFFDFSSDKDPRASIEKLSLDMQSRELDLTKGEGWRAALVKTGSDRFATVLVFHHMIIDRGSFESILTQSAAYYDDAVSPTTDAEEVDTGIQYADFSIWHNKHLKSAAMRPSIEYWRKELADSPSTGPLLPFARQARGQTGVISNAVHHVALNPTLLARMKRICASMELTPFQYVMAAFRTFHYRYTQANDLVIHVVDGNRPHAAVARTIGFFSNVIPVRLATQFDCAFETILKDTKGKMLKAVEHSGIPFDTIVNETNTHRIPGVFPLGQVIINYQIHGEMPKVPSRDFVLDGYDHEDIPTACEINLEAMEHPEDGLRLRMEHCKDLYLEEDMECFTENFLEFLSSTIKDHRQPVAEIPMVGPKERALIEAHIKPVTNMAEKSETIISQIMKQAQANPTKIAIQTSDGKTMKYDELIEAAQRVASALWKEGALPGTRIGLLANPGIEEVVGMLGCTICRCGYVPMDPSFGRERLSFMAEDSGCKIILTGEDVEALLHTDEGKPAFAQNTMRIAYGMKDFNKKTYEGHEASDPFFVTYTSGSTGKPKGIVLTHENILAMVDSLAVEYNFTSQDAMLHQSSMAFDLSLPQIYNALMCGGTTCIPTAETKQDPTLLADFMKTAGVTFTYFVPTQFAMLLEANREALKACNNWRIGFFAGEVVPARLAQAVYDLHTPVKVYSTWGPCEAVTQLTIHHIPNPVPQEKVPLGYPIPSCQAYVLDPVHNLVPRCVPGELYGGGPQVAGAYLNRPDVSAVSFPRNPFLSGRMLKTGDAGYQDKNGLFHFLGRVAGDKMIKLRGFRIDLGEVEQKIFDEGARLGAQKVANVSVIARSLEEETESSLTAEPADITDNRQIIAFVVMRKQFQEEHEAFVQQLHENLPKKLNRYMIPSGYDFVESLPTTIGGKVDMQNLFKRQLALIRPGTKFTAVKVNKHIPVDEEAHEQVVISETGDDATSEPVDIREAVFEQFRAVLNHPASEIIDDHDSFFDLGGNSMLLPRLQSRLVKELGSKITVAQIFNNPTPAGITAILSSETSIKVPATRPVKKTVSFSAPAPPSPAPVTTTEPQRPAARTVPTFSNKGGMTEEAPSPIAPTKAKANDEIDWRKEVHLPEDSRYQVPEEDDVLGPSEAPDTLLLGVDTFHGVHFLADYLTKATGTVHLIGVENKVTYDSVLADLEHYNLLSAAADITPDTIRSRTKCHAGTCSDFHFGLSTSTFARLGARLHSIYNLGASTSQVKTYSQLYAANVRPIFDLIELASCGSTPSAIHHFSTWSVPHLQTWHATRRTRTMISAAEEPVTHFSPSTTQRPGYIKTRWVCEILLTQAAARGFPVTIFRASAMSGSRKTGIPAPREGIIQQLITSFLQTGKIPDIEGFVVDFVPVDYVVAGVIALTQPQPYTPDAEKLAIRHLSNPEPLTLRRLQKMMPDISFCGPDEWLAAVLDEPACTQNEGDAARWAAIGGYIKEGHTMFALDMDETLEALANTGDVMDRGCPPINQNYLRRLLEDWESEGEDSSRKGLQALERRLGAGGMTKKEKRKSYGLSLLGVGKKT
ncbi:MAG: hypothetical protein Q9159_004300 [Coniocarpon cinnabarinum]